MIDREKEIKDTKEAIDKFFKVFNGLSDKDKIRMLVEMEKEALELLKNGPNHEQQKA